MEKSSLNFFSHSSLDRASELRLDENWLSTQLKAPMTYFVLLHHQKALVSQQHSLLLLRYDEIQPLLPPHTVPFLLGTFEQQSYFGIDVSNSLADDWKYIGNFEELRPIAPFLTENEANMIAQARAIAHWHKTNRFCGNCGSATVVQESGYKILCPNCGTAFFPRTDSAIIVQITYQDKCLLVRQPQWDKGRYANVAGFLEPAETLESAVRREVKEETGLTVSNVRYHSSQPWAFPASIMLGFTAEATHDQVFLDKNELEDFMWVTRQEMREKVQTNKISLPFRFSISHRLILDWFEARGEKLFP